MNYTYLKELFKTVKEKEGKEVVLKGWIRNHRKQKEFGFIDFSDGTCFKHLQIVYDKDLKNFDEITKFNNAQKPERSYQESRAKPEVCAADPRQSRGGFAEAS